MISVTFIQIPQWGSLTLLELLWTIIGGLTVTVSLYMLRIVTLAYFAIPENTVRRRVAKQYVRRELFRLAAGSSVLGAGIYIDFQPALMPGPAIITPSGLVILSMVYFLAIHVVCQSIGDWWDRRKVIQEIEKGGIVFHDNPASRAEARGHENE